MASDGCWSNIENVFEHLRNIQLKKSESKFGKKEQFQNKRHLGSTQFYRNWKWTLKKKNENLRTQLEPLAAHPWLSIEEWREGIWLYLISNIHMRAIYWNLKNKHYSNKQIFHPLKTYPL